MRLTSLLSILIVALALALTPASRGQAQEGLFSPRLLVNGETVTEYEHFQRKLFMGLLRTPGDLDAAAEEALIEDKLRLHAAGQLGISLTGEQVMAGMAEFAARANLSTEEFVEAIGQGGVQAESFRDFVEAGLVWREVVRARFAPRIQVGEAEIDRALALSAQRGVPASVLVSELILPMPAHKAEEVQALAKRLSATLRSEAAFAAAARQYSSAPTAENGGDLGWLPSPNLPGPARAALSGLRPGQVSEPLPVAGALALFYLRDIREAGETGPGGVHVEYAEFLIPGGQSAAAQAEAAAIRAEVDSCNDLYGTALGLPEDRLTVSSVPVASLSADVAREIEALDEGEVSTALTRGGAMVFLMLCKRQAGAPEALPAREAMRTIMINERLNGYSDSYMAELRAEAIIRRP